MPEGPEIHRAAAALHQAVTAQPITLTLLHPVLKPRQRALKNAHIVRVHARSKAMLTEFSNGDVLYSHNQLYGEWMLHTPTEPLRQRQVRLVIETAEQRAVLYSATDFAWLRAGREHLHPYIARLGPEVLAPGSTPARLAARLATFPRRRLADALLDQGVIAGLGNYLRADILWLARLAPTRRVGELSAAELKRLGAAIHRLTWRSVRHDGVLLAPAGYRALRRAGHGYEAARFFAFDRENLPCRACATPIARTTLGGRGVFFCPTCQPLP